MSGQLPFARSRHTDDVLVHPVLDPVTVPPRVLPDVVLFRPAGERELGHLGLVLDLAAADGRLADPRPQRSPQDILARFEKQLEQLARESPVVLLPPGGEHTESAGVRRAPLLWGSGAQRRRVRGRLAWLLFVDDIATSGKGGQRLDLGLGLEVELGLVLVQREVHLHRAGARVGASRKRA